MVVIRNGTKPQIVRRVRVKYRPDRIIRFHASLNNELIFPCDSSASVLSRGIHNESHLLCGLFLYEVARIVQCGHMRDIGKIPALRKHEIHFLHTGVIPIILKRICVSELFRRNLIVIGTFLVFRLVARACIHENCSSLARIPCEITVGAESKPVVIQSQPVLVTGIGGIPLGRVRGIGTAAEMPVNRAVPLPCL